MTPCLLVLFFFLSGSSGVFGESGGSDDLFGAPKKQPVSPLHKMVMEMHVVLYSCMVKVVTHSSTLLLILFQH